MPTHYIMALTGEIEMSKLFKGLKNGLREALAHAERKIILKSQMIEIYKSFKNITRRPNTKTKKAMRDIQKNKNLMRYKNVDDLWIDMGLDSNT